MIHNAYNLFFIRTSNFLFRQVVLIFYLILRLRLNSCYVLISKSLRSLLLPLSERLKFLNLFALINKVWDFQLFVFVTGQGPARS